MARINSELLERLENKLGLSRRRLYELIDKTGRATHLPRHLAAIVFASQSGINIFRYASPQELTEIRLSSPGVIQVAPAASNSPPAHALKKTAVKKLKNKSRDTVFVVHGRDEKVRNAMFTLLRALGLKPLEWSQAIRLTKQGSPYVGTILEKAFQHAAAIVVLLTPDDEARLKRKFQKPHDPTHEKNLTGQARPNVLFEAGMAFERNSNATVLVRVGEIRPFSDIGGRHVVHLTNSYESRLELATKLENASCLVDTTGADWTKAGDFSESHNT